MDVCLRELKESNKSRFDSYSVRNSVLIMSHITFRDCRVHFFSDNLSRNSCMLNNSFSTAAASLITRLFQLFRWCGQSNEIWAEKKNRLLLWRSAHLSVLTSPSLEVWKQLRPCLKKLPLPAAYTETHELDLWQLSETLPLWLKRSKEFVNLGKAILLQVPNETFSITLFF